MSIDGKPRIERLTTGVPSLDDILQGGFPVGSLNIISGGPGTGKSTLALQILFHQARLGKQNIYFTSIAEPAIKYLRYMQQFEFFDSSLVDKSVFFLDLSTPALSQGLEATIESLQRQVEEKGPGESSRSTPSRALRSRLQDQTAAHAILYELAVRTVVSGVTSFPRRRIHPGGMSSSCPSSSPPKGILALSTDTQWGWQPSASWKCSSFGAAPTPPAATSLRSPRRASLYILG